MVRTSEKLSSEELCLLARKNDEVAQEILWRRHENLVWNIANKLVKTALDDAIWAGYEGLYKAMIKYDAEKDVGGGFEKFAALLVTQAIIDWFRRTKKIAEISIEADVEDFKFVDLYDESPENEYLKKEARDEFMANVKKRLSDFEWKVWQQYTYGYGAAQIAELFGKSPKSVDNAIQRIKNKIRKSETHRS